MATTESLRAIHGTLDNIMFHTGHVIEEQVGRDTYPLIDESARPFDLYISIEVERIRGQVSHLMNNIHNEIVTAEMEEVGTPPIDELGEGGA